MKNVASESVVSRIEFMPVHKLGWKTVFVETDVPTNFPPFHPLSPEQGDLFVS
jgi:hypothetical protein